MKTAPFSSQRIPAKVWMINGKRDEAEADLDENCWKGYHRDGNKELFGKTVPNCVKNEAANPAQQAAIAIAILTFL